ncbi:MAG: sensor histidine kinase [Deltaproteobacteria bacterium]|nr:MAG: sensor histidine kinase [Deltaproteobacteria bacterium]
MTAAGELSWLLRLRWGAIAGQVLLIVGVEVLLGLHVDLLPLAAILGVEILSNAGLEVAWRRRLPLPEATTGVVLAVDVLLLTLLLHFSGGPYNPFSFLFLVHVALAAVTLDRPWTWSLTGLAAAGYGLLFLLDAEHRSHQADVAGDTSTLGLELHLRGMWVAFSVAAVFIAFFVHRVRDLLASRERELERARERVEKNERLASLATLAAGAAHELATPLATIAVVAKELNRRLDRADPEVLEDIRLIRSQVDRCRTVLDRMGAQAGERSGEGLASISVEALVERAIAGTDAEVSGPLPDTTLEVPIEAMVQTLRSFLKNAADAGARQVRIGACDEDDALVITVSDDGSGMPPEVLARAEEPFFTTKAPGAGMGLGLFLARALVDRLGGTLQLESEVGKGTVVTMRLPTAVRATIGRIAPPPPEVESLDR